MNYYTHNIGDFAIATQYLTDEELGIYVRLRDRYLSSEMPLQCEWIAMAMRTHCEQAVNNVLNLLFEKGDGFWFSDYLDEMIAAYQEKAEKASKSAKTRWSNSKRNTNAMQTECERNANASEAHSDRNANAMLTNNHKPITNNQEVIKKTRQKKVVEKPDEVTEQVWDDFCAIRKEKKAPLTKTALDLIKAEAEKAGIGLNEALSISCSRGWQSFKAEWMRGSQTRNDGFGAPSIEQPRPKSYEPDWDKIDYGETRPLSEC